MNSLKIFFVVLAFLMVNASASYKATVVANTLNVREKPTATSKVVGKLQKEDVVQVESCNSGFCKIESRSTSGYVSEKFLNPVSSTSADAEKSSSDGWGVLVLFIVLALGVTELGLRKKIGCISAAGAVVAISCLWLLLDVFHVGTGYAILVIALAILAIFMRNKKFLPKRFYKNELSDRNESSRKQKESFGDSRRSKPSNREKSGESIVDSVIKLAGLLTLGTTENGSENRELLYCQWISSELNQCIYETFPRNTSSRDAEIALQHRYGKGRLGRSMRAKTPPSWYELGGENEALYCQWVSSELVNQRFYGAFSRNTSNWVAEKALEHKYGKGHLVNSARAKTPPSWYELSSGKEVLYCQWISSELANHRFYETFPWNTINSNAEKALEHMYGKGRFGNTAQGKTPPSWYGF